MKVNFVGDIGLFKKFEELKIDPFDEINLPNSDFNIGNFEFVIPRIKEKHFYDVQDKYSCSFDYLPKLNIQKFHGLGFSNNHCLDYGLNGATDTIDYIKGLDINVFGFSQHHGYTLGEFKKECIKLAIIGCVKPGRWSKEKFGYGPDSYDTESICNLIKEIKGKYNHIVIFPHWGTELIEIPNLEDTKNAKKFIDAGASAVIGHHPHIPQGIELYEGGLIAYSLGSFIYIPEEEIGYSNKITNRDFSICLNIEFSEKEIKNYTPFFYRLDKDKFIPKRATLDEISNYPNFLNENIYNQHLYGTQVKKMLVNRELISFWQRFRSYPVRTIFNYLRLFRPKYILKIFR